MARLLSLITFAVLASGAVLSVSGCGAGEPSKEEIAQERTRLVRVLAAEVTRRDVAVASARESACRNHVGRALALLDREPQLFTPSDREDLVSVDAYAEHLRDIEAEMDRIPRGSLDPACLGALRYISGAAAVHNEVLEEWSDCLLRYALCNGYIDFCAVEKPTWEDCRDRKVDLNDTFELELSIMRDTAHIMRDEWKSARNKLKQAAERIDAIGVPSRTTTALPKTNRSVPRSVYGRADDLLCTGDRVPADALEACDALRKTLAQGVMESEEADLNQAIADVLDAYGLSIGEKQS